MPSKTMTISYLTQLPPGSKIMATLSGVVGFVFGNGAGGVSGAVAGTIAGAVVGLIGAVLSAMIVLRKQTTDAAIALDQERDAIMERANKVHQQEVESLKATCDRERV